MRAWSIAGVAVIGHHALRASLLGILQPSLGQLLRWPIPERGYVSCYLLAVRQANLGTVFDFPRDGARLRYPGTPTDAGTGTQIMTAVDTDAALTSSAVTSRSRREDR